jgi:tight adherence protein B
VTNATIAAMAAFACPCILAVAIAAVRRDAVIALLPGTDAGRYSSASRAPTSRRWLTFAFAIGGCAVGFVVGGPFLAAAGTIASALVPSVRARQRAANEAAALEDGLAEAVMAIAAAIRAGRSRVGALDEAASTVSPPLGPRLVALVDRVSLGVPVERAVAELAGFVPGSEGRLVAAVLGLHQRSGGDAAGVLDRVARTLRERRASAREVHSLTVQARLSGAILGFLPIGFFLFLSVTARAEVDRALASSTGVAAIAAGLTMQAVAFLWIRRLLRVDV